MESLVNAFLAIGLLVIIVLMIYLVDRINSLEKETRRVAQGTSGVSAAPSDPWAGLSGKALWDAMTGRPPAGMSPGVLQELRARYELVLHKHIQSLFDEGARDGPRGLSGEPKNPRVIETSHGPVDSWMPAPQANTIYQCGLDSTQVAPEGLASVRQALDEAGQLLFSKVQLSLTEPLSVSLMPQAPVLSATGVPALGAQLPGAGTGAAPGPST